MSRAYRISVRECEDRTVRADDRVSTRLEMLEILPPEQMAALLAGELERRGFRREDGLLVRRENGVVLTVDPECGEATATAEAAERVHVESTREGRAYDDVGPDASRIQEQLREEARRDLDKKASEKTAALQTQVTDRLEAALGAVRRELDQAVNRVTAEALKQKAASLGQIKELTEDPQTGSLTIVVEV
jgi:hypothetical protein